MGMLVVYELSRKQATQREIRPLVEAMRQLAFTLPFQKVGEVKEFHGKDVNPDTTCDASDRWLKIEARRKLMPRATELQSVKDQATRIQMMEENMREVDPSHIVAFSAWLGQGCEVANFGLCHYPGTESRDLQGRKRRLPKNLKAKLKGWSWKSACKTQYASDPKCGSVENFLRCHLCLIGMLDAIQRTGLANVTVKDDGRYWETRDLQTLVKELTEWNELVAAAVSSFRSSTNGRYEIIEAPITGFQNFEHLEAKGLYTYPDLPTAIASIEDNSAKRPVDGQSTE